MSWPRAINVFWAIPYSRIWKRTFHNRNLNDWKWFFCVFWCCNIVRSKWEKMSFVCISAVGIVVLCIIISSVRSIRSCCSNTKTYYHIELCRTFHRFGQAKLGYICLWWFGFRLEPIFAIPQGASKKVLALKEVKKTQK